MEYVFVIIFHLVCGVRKTNLANSQPNLSFLATATRCQIAPKSNDLYELLWTLRQTGATTSSLR